MPWVSENSFGGQVTVGETRSDRLTPGPVEGQGDLSTKVSASHGAVSADHHELQGGREIWHGSSKVTEKPLDTGVTVARS